jgi:hypothetical protein
VVLIGLMASAPVDRTIVPVELEVALLARVLRYDRNFAARSGDQVRVLVVYAPASAESVRVSREFMTALQGVALLGGVAHRDELLAFATAAEVAAQVKERHATLVILAPELAGAAPALAPLLEGCDCLTVSSTPEGVREGWVLGFDLVSGKPRMLFNLTRSRRQNADFRAEVLQLMTVFP